MSKVDLICEYCEKPYQLPTARARRSRCCCRECMSALRRREATQRWFWDKVDRRGPDECWPWTGQLDAYGYGRKGGARAHRFSWELANGRSAGEMLVRHECDNRSCVNPAHLLLGTHEDNMADMDARNRRPRGEAVKTSVLTDEGVRRAIREYREGATLAELSVELDVAESTLHKAITGKTWKHVCELRLVHQNGHARGASHKLTHLTDGDVRKIRRLSAGGMSQREIAERFDLAQPTVSQIVVRKTWKHVT